VGVDETTAVARRPSLSVEKGLRSVELLYSPLFPHKRKKKLPPNTWRLRDRGGGGQIVSPYVGRNEMSLGGHKNRGLFRGVVGQAFF
jgi:hypothetical protein